MGTNKKVRKAKISSQMQVRIPRDLYEKYGFDTEAEVVETETGVEFRPIKSASARYAELLEDLVEQGLDGEELIARFKEQSKDVDTSVSYHVVPLDDKEA